MSGLPRVIYEALDAQPVQSAPTDSTTAFVVAESIVGPSGPLDMYSTRDADRQIGGRTGVNIDAWDCIDVLLRERVTHVVFSRLFGPSPQLAKAQLAGTGGSGYSMGFTATEYGAAYNGASGSGYGWSVDIDAPDGTHRIVTVLQDGDVVLATPSLTTRAALSDALANLDGVTVDLGSDTTLPVATGSPVAFTGGTDDVDNVTGTEIRAAADRIGRGKGPGQVFTPGRNSPSTGVAIFAHCQAQNRSFLPMAEQGLSVAALKSLAATYRALGTGAEGQSRLGLLTCQYKTIDAPAPGSKRTVPAAWITGGLIARAERAAGHPNVDAMGNNGRGLLKGAMDRYFTDDEADELVDAGVNVFVDYLGEPRLQSFVTLDDPTTSQWIDFAHTRFERVLQAKADEIGHGVQGEPLDGQGLAAQDFGGKLRDMLSSYWPAAIFGDSAEDAYVVDTGPSVNTIDTLAADQVHAAIGVKMAPHAWFVFITNAKVPITQPLATA